MEAHYFTILWWLLPYMDMNQPCMYMYLSILNPPPTSLPPATPSHPSGLSPSTSDFCILICILQFC